MIKRKGLKLHCLPGKRITAYALAALMMLLPAAASSRDQGAGAEPTSLKSADLQNKSGPLKAAGAGAQEVSGPKKPAANGSVPAQGKLKQLEKQWGIEIVGIRLSGAGYMLDFRFKVIDPEKAKPLLDRAIKPYLIDEATKARFQVPSTPKVGALRQTTRQPEANKVYFTFFANPGNVLKPGNKVSVVIGKFKAEHLEVSN